MNTPSRINQSHWGSVATDGVWGNSKVGETDIHERTLMPHNMLSLLLVQVCMCHRAMRISWLTDTNIPWQPSRPLWEGPVKTSFQPKRSLSGRGKTVVSDFQLGTGQSRELGEMPQT